MPCKGAENAVTIIGPRGLEAACTPPQTRLSVLARLARNGRPPTWGRLHFEEVCSSLQGPVGSEAHQEADRPQACCLGWLEGALGIYRAPGGAFVLGHPSSCSLKCRSELSDVRPWSPFTVLDHGVGPPLMGSRGRGQQLSRGPFFPSVRPSL